MMTTCEQRRWKSAMMGVFDAGRYTTAITLAWNRPVTRMRARQDLATLLAGVDCQLLGPRFHRKGADVRTDAVFVFEGLDTGHVHVHSMWRAPNDRWFEMGKLFKDWRCVGHRRKQHGDVVPVVGIWNRVVPSGSVKIDAMNVAGRNDEFTGYALKGQHANSDVRDIVWARDFHTRP